MFLFFASSYSQVLYEEDFEGPASSWNIDSMSPNCLIDSNLYLSGQYSVRIPDSTIQDEFIITNSIPLGASVDDIYLEFDHISKTSFFSNCRIYVSRDKGLTWDSLYCMYPQPSGGLDTVYLGIGNYCPNGNKFASNSYFEWAPANPVLLPDNSWWMREVFRLSPYLSPFDTILIKYQIKKHIGFPNSSYGWNLDNISLIQDSCFVTTHNTSSHTSFNFTEYPIPLSLSFTDQTQYSSTIEFDYTYYTVNSVPIDTLYDPSPGIPSPITITLDTSVISIGDTIRFYAKHYYYNSTCVDSLTELLEEVVIYPCDTLAPSISFIGYQHGDTIDLGNTDSLFVQIVDSSALVNLNAKYAVGFGGSWQQGQVLNPLGNGLYWFDLTNLAASTATILKLQIFVADSQSTPCPSNSIDKTFSFRLIFPCDTVPPVINSWSSIPDTMFINQNYSIQYKITDAQAFDALVLYKISQAPTWNSLVPTALVNNLFEFTIDPSLYLSGNVLQFYVRAIDYPENIFGPCPENIDSTTVLSSVIWDPNIGIRESKISEISFSNPVDDEIAFFNLRTEIRVQLFNYLGQLIMETSVEPEDAVMRVAGIKPGPYVLRILDNQGDIFTHRVVIY